MLNEIFQELRNKVPRVTRARKVVLRSLYEAERPLTAQEIHSRMADEDIDAATVYRNLEKLSSLGLVNKVEHSRQGIRYALTCTRHTHSIRCTHCNSRVEIGECFMNDVEQLVKQRTGFQKIHHTVNFSGVCPECHSKA